MSSSPSQDFKIIDIDPLTEIIGNHVTRRRDRKLQEFFASQVVIIQGLFSLVECLVPGCKGHSRYGYVASDNSPAFYRYHEKGKEAVYTLFRNSLNRPIRVPLDGDIIINGIKWTLRSLDSIATNSQTIFDCLLANLKLQTLRKHFCLECLFMHRNGLGLHFEKVLKTVLHHIIAYGRYLEKDSFFPVSRYEPGMTLRFKRAFFEKEDCFRYSYLQFKDGFRESLVAIEKNTSLSSYPSSFRQGRFIDVDFSVLRHLSPVSSFDVTLQCGCDSGRIKSQHAYVALLRRNHHQSVFNLAMATWKMNGGLQEDPLWMHSLLGENGPNASVTRVKATPLASICSGCQNMVSVRSIVVPESTWLLICDVSENLYRCSLEGLSSLAVYVVGGVVFRLAFIVLYNQATGNFTSMNFSHGEWNYYEDNLGGLLKTCNPGKLRYKDRVNARVYYIRDTVSDENHRCLSAAFNRLNL
jgi:hypothetical protein